MSEEEKKKEEPIVCKDCATEIDKKGMYYAIRKKVPEKKKTGKRGGKKKTGKRGGKKKTEKPAEEEKIPEETFCSPCYLKRWYGTEKE